MGAAPRPLGGLLRCNTHPRALSRLAINFLILNVWMACSSAAFASISAFSSPMVTAARSGGALQGGRGSTNARVPALLQERLALLRSIVERADRFVSFSFSFTLS